MLRLLTVALALAIPTVAVAQTCLPTLALPKAWTACAADDDCVLAGDGCRSCGAFLPVHKAHRDAATKKDAAARAAAKCVMTCEACASEAVTLRCVEATCRAERRAP
jgi:hypothetical protein